MKQNPGLTEEESGGVLESLLAPLPVTFTDLTDDEEDDRHRCIQQRGQHQKLEAVYQTLRVRCINKGY